WRRCEKNSERGVEPDTERAGAERRDLIATDGERRAQREAVAHFIGKVGQTHRDTEIVATDARRQPGVEIVALRLAELGSDTKARTADIVGPALDRQLHVCPHGASVIETDASREPC